MSALATFSVHLITSRERLAPDAATVARQLVALEAQLDEAIDAGVDVIQVRERDLEARVLAALVSRLLLRTHSTPTTVLVSERADVARAAGADGLHLPSFGLPAGRARALDPTWIVGRSVHAGDDPACAEGCDYVLFGTVFPSESKGEGAAVAGPAALARAVRLFKPPVVAIGGVTPDRAGLCLDAGAIGVAAIGAFLPPGRAREARGPRQAVAQFRAVLAARRTVPSSPDRVAND